MSDPTILIVDDDEAFASILVDACRMIGHEAVRASGVTTGMAAIETWPGVKLALVDIQLDRESGFDFVALANARLPDLAFIMLSGLGAHAPRPEGYEDVTIVKKTLSIPDLGALIERVLT